MGTIVIHGGAGGGGEAQREGVLDALRTGVAVLRAGGTALEAACAGVAAMEATGLFNAGRGAVHTRDGLVELDAAAMRGADRAAGAVASISLTQHPILAAKAVLDAGDAVLLSGIGADEFAVASGLDVAPDGWFVSAGASRCGTVGAVAVDDNGVCAAATSTGGRDGQRRGRVGDSPLIGAGTYADERCAVSATGDGEQFIRAVFAHSVARYYEQGVPLRDACSRGLAEVAALDGTGGCIAISADGGFAIDHTTAVMPAGYATTDGRLHAQLTRWTESALSCQGRR